MTVATKTYLFNWLQGGYNVVRAKTKRGAIKEIKRRFGGCNLIPLESSIRVATQVDIDAEDRRWGPFD